MDLYGHLTQQDRSRAGLEGVDEDVEEHQAGGWGAIIGLFAGLIVPPVGMIVGSLLGAFIAELVVANKDTATSIKSALGAFLGFLFGTGAKLVAAGLMLFYIFVYAF